MLESPSPLASNKQITVNFLLAHRGSFGGILFSFNMFVRFMHIIYTKQEFLTLVCKSIV